MTSQKRRWILGLLLAGTLLAGIFAPSDNKTVVLAPNKSQSLVSRSRPASPQIEVLSLHPRNQAEAATPFESRSWQVTPTPEPAKPVALDTTSQAPTLPFRLLGKYIEEGTVAVFLSYGERNFVARAGDTIEGLYRIEKLNDDEMVLIYLPLGQRQHMALGSAN